MLQTVITGSGAYIPPIIQKNTDFANHIFYTEDNRLIETPAPLIAKKFSDITGIEERRYAPENMNASGMAIEAARLAIADSGINPEELDQIIVAHNYGDVVSASAQTDSVPSLASRVKNGLGIKNPAAIAYDILFGCPGWLQALVQADIYCKAGAAKKCLVIGTETLSRVIDVHDRDSMIFSDGAGACILEYKEVGDNGPGILGSNAQSNCTDEAWYIYFGKSNSPETNASTHYIKMKGRKVYEYAVKEVPAAMKGCLEKSGVDIRDLKKIFIHQANEKMDAAIVREFYKLYNEEPPEHVMPMCIHWLGNSSVATIPTLYDLVRKNQVQDHALQPGDVVLFASVGAGMNINAVCYRY